MKNCIECNHRFTFSDRLKSVFEKKAYLKCPECNSGYTPKITVYRGIYDFLVFFITLRLWNRVELNSLLLECILYVLIAIPILSLYDVIPHRWQKYTKIN